MLNVANRAPIMVLYLLNYEMQCSVSLLRHFPFQPTFPPHFQFTERIMRRNRLAVPSINETLTCFGWWSEWRDHFSDRRCASTRDSPIENGIRLSLAARELAAHPERPDWWNHWPAYRSLCKHIHHYRLTSPDWNVNWNFSDSMISEKSNKTDDMDE